MLKALEDGAQAVGVQLHPVAVHSLTDFEGAFAAMRAGHAEALLILGSALHASHVRRLADLALQNRLPAMAWLRAFHRPGGSSAPPETRNGRGAIRASSSCRSWPASTSFLYAPVRGFCAVGMPGFRSRPGS